MSRTTSTQIIEKGDYLNEDFDPTTLTVPHLLSILTLHSIKYPTPYNKTKLVQAFNEHVKPRANEFIAERIKRDSILASSHGITDGLTGASLSEPEQIPEVPPQLRRSSRRLSRPPSQEPPTVKPDPHKRRRSSAGPALLRASVPKTVAPQEPTVAEESEPEDEPVKKVGRPRKSVAAAGPQGRRISQSGDIEGWSDNNVFQSGAESSSPSRPPPKGAIVVRQPNRRPRTSMSAPPQMPSSSPFAVPTITFEPKLPPAPEFRRSPLSSPLQMATKKAAERRGAETAHAAFSSVEEEQEEEQSLIHDEDSPEALVEKVSNALANGGSGRTRNRPSEQLSQGLPTWVRLLCAFIFVAAMVMSVQYKKKSVPIGYCYPGSNTNSIIEVRKAEMLAAEECLRKSEMLENFSDAGSNMNEACLPPVLFPFLEPLHCTPCPTHAFCTIATVTCEQGYLLKEHPLAWLPLLPSVFNGFPGFWPIAFPPSCIQDAQRKNKIGRLGIALESYLATVRGQRKCVETSGPESSALVWGVKLDAVHDILRKGTVTKKLVNSEEFESLFEHAVADLNHYGFIILEDTVDGAFIASKRAEMNLACKIRVQAQEAWQEWRRFFAAVVFVIISVLVFRQKVAARRADNRRIRELAQVAMDSLRNQELAHHTDPVTTPYPYLPSIHLRDLILQDEHSVSARRKLWDRVEKIVEGNTNVRATMEELEGGDEGKVWRWVGGVRAPIR